MIGIGRLRSAVLAAAAGCALLACASSRPAGPSDPRDQVVVEVRNDLVQRGAVTVRMISPAGARVLMGSIAPGRTQRLRVRQAGLRGVYRFVAEPIGGEAVVSSGVNLVAGNTTLRWRLFSNVLTVVDESGPRNQRP